MTNEELVSTWVETLGTQNEGEPGAWSARFELDGAALVERATKDLEVLGITLRSDGVRPLERSVVFDRAQVRDVSTILVNQGARLCTDGVRQPAQ